MPRTARSRFWAPRKEHKQNSSVGNENFNIKINQANINTKAELRKKLEGLPLRPLPTGTYLRAWFHAQI